MSLCLNSPLLNKGFGIFIQVIFIFIFLTIFFFTYVTSVEKETFKSQMDLLVDNIISDEDLKSIIPTDSPETESIFINGTLEYVKNKANNQVATDNEQIKNTNDRLEQKATKWLIAIVGILVVIILSIYVMGFCVPFHIHGKNALYSVFFVALTELAFLLLITKNYWSVNPDDVRVKIGEAIKDYIKNR